MLGGIRASRLQSLGGAGANKKKRYPVLQNTHTRICIFSTLMEESCTHTHTHRNIRGSNRQWASVNGVMGGALQRCKTRAVSLNGIPSMVAGSCRPPLSCSGEKVTPGTQRKDECTQARGEPREKAFTHRCAHVASFQSHSSYGYWLPKTTCTIRQRYVHARHALYLFIIDLRGGLLSFLFTKQRVCRWNLTGRKGLM